MTGRDHLPNPLGPLASARQPTAQSLVGNTPKNEPAAQAWDKLGLSDQLNLLHNEIRSTFWIGCACGFSIGLVVTPVFIVFGRWFG